MCMQGSTSADPCGTNSTTLRNSDLASAPSCPDSTRADIIAKVKAHRDEIRQRVVKFLTPEQLTKWDSEIAKAKEFLGQKVDA